MKQTEAQVEEIRRRHIRKEVGRRALKEIGRIVEDHEREERARERLVWRLWLPLVALVLVAALVFVLLRM